MSGKGDIEHPWTWSSGGTALIPGATVTPAAHGDITGEAPTSTDPDRLLGSLTWTTGGTPITSVAPAAPTGKGGIPDPFAFAGGGTALTPGAHAAPTGKGDIAADYQGAEQYDSLPSGNVAWASGGTPITPAAHAAPIGKGDITGDYGETEAWQGIYTWDSGGPPVTIQDSISYAGFTSGTFYDHTLAANGSGSSAIVLVGTNAIGVGCYRSTDGGTTFSGVPLSSMPAGLPISNGMAYGNGIFLYNAASVGIAISTDGLNWTQNIPSPAIPNIGSSNFTVQFGNGVFVIVNRQVPQQPWVSPNGGVSSWTEANATGIAAAWGAFIFDGAVFAGINGALLFTSADGLNWQSIPFSTSFSFVAGNAKAKLYGCVSGSQPARIRLASSYSGLGNAPDITVPFNGGDLGVFNLAIDNLGTVVAFGNYGSVSISRNSGAAWTEETVPWNHSSSISQQWDPQLVVIGNTVYASTIEKGQGGPYVAIVTKWVDGLNMGQPEGDITDPYSWEDVSGALPPTEYSPGAPA